MNYRQTLVLAVGSILIAVILPTTILEMGSHQPTANEFFNNESPYGLIVRLGNSGNDNSWFDGLYARPGITPFEGVIFGMIVPLVALLTGIYLIAGIGGKPSDPTNSWLKPSNKLLFAILFGIADHWKHGAIVVLCIVGAFALTVLFWLPLAVIWTAFEFLVVGPEGRQQYMNREIVPIGSLIVLFGLFPIALSIVMVRVRLLIGLSPEILASK